MRGAIRWLVGAFSIASGAALVVAPEAMSRLYGLPPRTAVGRALGLRDVAVGALLLGAPQRRTGWLARGLADGFDAVMIARRSLARRPSVVDLGRFTVAVALSAVALTAARPRRRGLMT